MVDGDVVRSNWVSQEIAYSRLSPHISAEACNPEQHAGRPACPKIAQRKSVVSCMHGTAAGLPFGIPGIGLLMDGAVQQAAQLGRQWNALISLDEIKTLFYLIHFIESVWQ